VTTLNLSIVLSDILLPEWLFISQWVLLCALGFLVLVAYRQIGHLARLDRRSSKDAGLPLGTTAPAFEYLPVHSPGKEIQRFEPGKYWSLLVFAEPGCTSCVQALAVLEKLAPRLSARLHIQILTSASLKRIQAADDPFNTTMIALGVINEDIASTLYHVSMTPFAYLVNPEGRIQAKGPVPDERAIKQVIQSMSHRTIQVTTRTS
jgi:hypothetical protein